MVLQNEQITELLKIEYQKLFDCGVCPRIPIDNLLHHRYILTKIISYASKTNWKYLDVSIGSGFVARVLKNFGYEVYGIDSKEIAGDIDKRFEETGIQIYDLKIEQEQLPFTENEFDLVYWGATIEHLHNSPKHSMKEMYRVLKKGGYFIIDTPNIVSLKKRLLMLFGISFMPSIEYVYNSKFHGSHHREYTMNDLIKVCTWTGYEIIEKVHLDTFWPLSVKKFGKLGINRSSEKEKTVFALGFNWLNWYDWCKLPALLLCKLFPQLRETLIVVCKKPFNEK